MTSFMKARIAAVSAAMLACSGCFEMKQDFRFNADGTARIDIRMAIDAALIAMASAGGASDDWCGKGIPEQEGLTVDRQLKTEGSDSVCLVSVSGQIDDVIAAVSQADGGDRAKQNIKLTEEGEHYRLLIELPSFQAQSEETDNPLASTMQTMMLAKMSGRVLAWSVSAPQIIETSGTLSEDKTTASYSRPLAEAFTSPAPTKFDVTFSLQEPGFAGWLKSFFN